MSQVEEIMKVRGELKAKEPLPKRLDYKAEEKKVLISTRLGLQVQVLLLKWRLGG